MYVVLVALILTLSSWPLSPLPNALTIDPHVLHCVGVIMVSPFAAMMAYSTLNPFAAFAVRALHTKAAVVTQVRRCRSSLRLQQVTSLWAVHMLVQQMLCPAWFCLQEHIPYIWCIWLYANHLLAEAARTEINLWQQQYPSPCELYGCTGTGLIHAKVDPFQEGCEGGQKEVKASCKHRLYFSVHQEALSIWTG